MATKKRYTEDFKKKVVDEYKNGDLTLKEVAAKYKIPPALLQDWVNKDKVNDYIISIVDNPNKKTTSFTKISVIAALGYQKLKANGWLLACCLPLFLSLLFIFNFNDSIIETEINENNRSVQVKMDSLIEVNNELKGEIGKLGLTLEKIDNELELKITPSITVNNDNKRITNDNRKYSNSKKKSVIKNKIETDVNVEHMFSNYSVFQDSCCCRCGKDSIR